eukprot:gene37902-46769_t
MDLVTEEQKIVSDKVSSVVDDPDEKKQKLEEKNSNNWDQRDYYKSSLIQFFGADALMDKLRKYDSATVCDLYDAIAVRLQEEE